MTESLLILATVMQHYRLPLVENHVVELDAVYTLRPSNGVLVNALPA